MLDMFLGCADWMSVFVNPWMNVGFGHMQVNGGGLARKRTFPSVISIDMHWTFKYTLEFNKKHYRCSVKFPLRHHETRK
jgi:hypothetical protein